MEDTDFETLYEKAKESHVNCLLWDARLPSCSGVFSDENESPQPGSSGSVAKKPTAIAEGLISSPQFQTPQSKKINLPFKSCNESPISTGIYAASTPFHGQRIVSVSSNGSGSNRVISFGNETFDKLQTPNTSLRSIALEACANNTFQVGNSDLPPDTRNATFDMKSTTNQTFALERSTAAKDMTMAVDGVLDSRQVTFDAKNYERVNQTFAAECSAQTKELSMAADDALGSHHATFDGKSSERANHTFAVELGAQTKEMSVVGVSGSHHATFDAKSSERGFGNRTFGMESTIQSHKDFMVIESSLESAKELQENMSVFTDTQLSTFGSKSSELGSMSDPMESSTKPEYNNGDSTTKAPDRKPLRSIPQPKARSAIPKRDESKKTSKLSQPRMNTAAISRIQAQSPQARPSSADSGSKIGVFKRPSSGAAARKSLLPPCTTTKLPASAKSRTLKAAGPAKQEDSGKLERSVTPAKRKAQKSPKRVGSSAKIAGNPSTARKPTTSARTRSQVSHNNSGLRGPKTYSRPCKKNANTSQISSVQSQKSDETKQAMRVPTEGNLRPNREAKKPSVDPNCHVALAVLLDHVVNTLDGFSAPRLSREIASLKHVVERQETARSLLSKQVEELETVLSAERQQSQQYADKLSLEQRDRAECQSRVAELESEIENMRQEHRSKINQLEMELEERKTQYDATVAAIQERYENECQALRDGIESTVAAQLEEQMKPYVNARSEVESMTTVLEMKNDAIHKLQMKCSELSSQRDSALLLGNRVDQLSQQNEDLSSRLQEKTEETRQLSAECNKLQRSFSEEQNALTKLRQHNEQLRYRLDSVSPTSSPFNPVYTVSPTNGVFDSSATPQEQKSLRNHRIQNPRVLHYQYDGDGRECDDTS